MAEQTEPSSEEADLNPTQGLDRRALLRRAAAAGAVGWVAPIIISTSAVSAGVFTAKCAPGSITATATFVRINCLASTSSITITITFSGPCPCGGTKRWCAQKNTPSPIVSSSAATLSFPVTIPAGGSTVITGKVALGCADLDGDIQYATYNWSMSAFDNFAACSTVVNSLSAVTLSGRTLVNSVACPSLAALAAFAAPASIAGAGTRPP
jgi:hypothetical protein